MAGALVWLRHAWSVAMQPDQSRRIKGLDGLRAVAVLMVFAEHRVSGANRFGLGGYGVHLFFVLSGFLIMSLLHADRQKIEAGKRTALEGLLRFYAARAFRIWPIYYLLVAGLLVASILHLVGPISATGAAGMLTFTVNLLIGYVWHSYPDHYGHLWSIATEEQFYLLAAPLALFLPARHTTSICWAGVVVAGAYFAASSGVPGRAGYVGPFVNFGLMGMGGLAALAAPRLCRAAAWARIAPGILAAYLLTPVLGHALPTGVPQQVVFWGSSGLCVLLIATVAKHQDCGFVRVLGRGPIWRFGQVSYGFYLLHGLIEISIPAHHSVATAVNFVLSTAAAFASWHLLERPVLQLRDRFMPREVVAMNRLGTAQGIKAA